MGQALSGAEKRLSLGGGVGGGGVIDCFFLMWVEG